MKDVFIREAKPSDVQELFHVRTSVNENTTTYQELDAMGITLSSIKEMIESSPCAWVAVQEERVLGFSMIIPEDGCLFAAFVLPAYEGLGIGKKLVQAAEDALFIKHSTLWLETGKSTRAAEFYRRRGWKNETEIGEGDIRLEKDQF
ncbi:GNAT family N-acetyltransferase [Rouxiella silvae]|uniref:GNAT family N-acetyltransferase n=1 Tax=Rouxiella silvae TaxID=1646373 RepID=A0AA40X2L1_9GAMM|nr:GNAT family N-acetyltransferase [Rouxiella silvae]MBF6637537.1 GNAT family N-acetyltransferase [Rouxiella silvae]ORJ19421.1 GNAT family N-acetyltransferase [Rouxiella silvae]